MPHRQARNELSPGAPAETPTAETLREHGVHVTAQRVAIARAVSANPHATTDEIVDAVRYEIGSISRQAVYDTLNVFVEKRLIRRIQPAGSVARYEDRVGDTALDTLGKAF